MRHRSLEEPPPHRPSASSVLSPRLPTPSCREQIPPPRAGHTPNRSRHPADPQITVIQSPGSRSRVWDCRRMLEAQKYTDPQSLSILWCWSFPQKRALPDLQVGWCIWVCRGRAGPGRGRVPGSEQPLAPALPAIPEPHCPGAAEGKGGTGLTTWHSSELQRARGP